MFRLLLTHHKANKKYEERLVLEDKSKYLTIYRNNNNFTINIVVLNYRLLPLNY